MQIYACVYIHLSIYMNIYTHTYLRMYMIIVRRYTCVYTYKNIFIYLSFRFVPQTIRAVINDNVKKNHLYTHALHLRSTFTCTHPLCHLFKLHIQKVMYTYLTTHFSALKHTFWIIPFESVAVCCSVLQCVAVCWSALKHTFLIIRHVYTSVKSMRCELNFLEDVVQNDSGFRIHVLKDLCSYFSTNKQYVITKKVAKGMRDQITPTSNMGWLRSVGSIKS